MVTKKYRVSYPLGVYGTYDTPNEAGEAVKRLKEFSWVDTRRSSNTIRVARITTEVIYEETVARDRTGG